MSSDVNVHQTIPYDWHFIVRSGVLIQVMSHVPKSNHVLSLKHLADDS